MLFRSAICGFPFCLARVAVFQKSGVDSAVACLGTYQRDRTIVSSTWLCRAHVEFRFCAIVQLLRADPEIAYSSLIAKIDPVCYKLCLLGKSHICVLYGRLRVGACLMKHCMLLPESHLCLLYGRLGVAACLVVVTIWCCDTRSSA